MNKRQNIILVTLDTTRADHLSCYGYNRPTSPNLDKLAGESVFYTRAVSPSSWTLPAHASLFTGKYTSSHGAKYDTNGPLCLADTILAPEAWEKYRKDIQKYMETMVQVKNFIHFIKAVFAN